MSSYRFTDAAVWEKNCWPKVEACYSRTWEFFDMPAHFHDRAEIMYVLKGWCLVHLYEYRQDSASRKTVITRQWTERLGPGEFIFLDQFVMHRLEILETNYMLNAEFKLMQDDAALVTVAKLAKASPALRELMKNGRQILRGKDEQGLVLHAMERVITDFTQPLPKDLALTDIMLAELIIQIAGKIKYHSNTDNASGYAYKAVDYIISHFTEDIRVGDIARLVGIAPAYLQRVFKQTVDMTIVEYINHLRIQQSKQLLIYTDDSIVDIAVASGFNSRQHFFRVFNAATGVSPQQFRQESHGIEVRQVYNFDNIQDTFFDTEGNIS